MRRFFTLLFISILPFLSFADFYKISGEEQIWNNSLTSDFLSTYDGIQGGKFIFEFVNTTAQIGLFSKDFTFDCDVELLNKTEGPSTGNNMFHARFNVQNGALLTFNKSFLLNAKIKTRLDFRSDDINKFANVLLKSNVDFTGGISQDWTEFWLQSVNLTYQAQGGRANAGYTHFFHGANLIVKNCEFTMTNLAIRVSDKFENSVRQRGTIVADGAVVIFNGLINQDAQDGVFKFKFANGGTFWFKYYLSTLIAEGSSVVFENMSAGDVIKTPDCLSADSLAETLSINGEKVATLISDGKLIETKEGDYYIYTYQKTTAKQFYNIPADKVWTSSLPAYFLSDYRGFTGETFLFRFGNATQTVGMFDSDFIFDCPVLVNNTTTVSSMYHATFSINEASTILFNKSFLLQSDIKTRLDFRSEGSQKFGTVILKNGVEFEGKINQDQCEFWLHRVNLIYNAENQDVYMGYTHFENAPNVVAKDCNLTMTTLAIRSTNVALGSYFELGSATVDKATFTVINLTNQNSYAGEFCFKFKRGGTFIFERELSVLTSNSVIVRFDGMNKGDVIKTKDDISAETYFGKITINGSAVADLISSGVLVKTFADGKYVYTYSIENKELLLSTEVVSTLAGKELQFVASCDNEVRTYILLRNGIACKAQQTPEFNFIEDVAGDNSYEILVIYPDSTTELSNKVSVKVGQVSRFFVSTIGSDSNDGSSWHKALASVSFAVEKASLIATDGVPTEIWIATGEYSISTPIKLSAGVQLYGGFAGTEKSLSERVEGNETILSGGNSNRIFENIFSYNNELSNTATLERLTLTSGYTEEGGGAIYNYYANPTISNCKFVGNNSGIDGGAIYNEYSSPIITDCSFNKNQSSCGGAVAGYKSNAKMKQCTFTENVARSGGGAVYNDRGNTSVSICKFTNNTAIYGGAIYNDNTYASIENSQMSGNKANFGGAIYNGQSWPSLANLTINDNVAFVDGAGIYCDLSSPSISNCTIVNNKTYADGGAIYTKFASSTSTINNCTISNNTTEGKGGALFVENASKPTIKNSILWNNSSSDNLQIAQFDTLDNPTVNNCIVQGGLEYGTNIIDASPALLPLEDYGGYVQTCALSESSAAIGKCVASDNFTSTDARCFPRGTPACLGACEYLPTTLTSTSQNSDIFQGDEVSLNVVSDCDFAFYQWQVSFDGGKSWQDIKNANSATFKADDIVASTNEYLYRCKVSQPQRDTAYSAVSTITVWQNTTFGHWACENNLRGQNGAENSKRFFDNITNLERFVFGFPVDKPTSYSANSMFKQVATTQAAGLVFPVRKSATDVNVIAKYSADLQNWQVAQTQKIGEQGDFYLYCAEVDFAEKGKVFFKIEISQ